MIRHDEMWMALISMTDHSFDPLLVSVRPWFHVNLYRTRIQRRELLWIWREKRFKRSKGHDAKWSKQYKSWHLGIFAPFLSFGQSHRNSWEAKHVPRVYIIYYISIIVALKHLSGQTKHLTSRSQKCGRLVRPQMFMVKIQKRGWAWHPAMIFIDVRTPVPPVRAGTGRTVSTM